MSVGPKHTEEQVRAYRENYLFLKEHGVTVEVIAERIGVLKGTLQKWINQWEKEE